MSNSGQTSKPKKHYTFTYHHANATPPPNIILKYTPSNAPPPQPQQQSQRISLTAKKSQPAPSQPKKPPPTGLGKTLNDIWKKISQKDTQKIFAYPVTEDIAPGYFNVVKHPMDLSTIKAKIHDDEYQTLQQFRDDMNLMFTNCLTYNPNTTFVYQQGEALFQFFRRQLKLAKKQLLGNSQQTTSSSLNRAITEGAQEQREAIESLPIPVVFESAPKVIHQFPEFLTKPPNENDKGKDVLMSYYVPTPNTHTNDSFDMNQQRFDTFCDIIRETPDLQKHLKLLKENYPQYIINDAVRQFSGINASFPIPDETVNSAINNDKTSIDIDEVDALIDGERQQVQKPGSIGVGEAPVPINFMHELSASIPELPLEVIRPHLSGDNDLLEQNLRLMLFYINTMQYWKGADLLKAKQTMLEKIKDNITKLIMEIPPNRILKTQALHILQHINVSIAT
ncbi:Bromodomain containing protein 7 [Tritrichomonas musculus]|uniref:Bromodomain containing protein 7 n=1 Tax=Tritrichomonas musculus TaxID=1915356 RepID=A0ABR2JUM3_9EUKA